MASPNTLTGLLPVIYEAYDIVSRELTGMIPAVTMDASADRVAKDEVVRWPVTPVLSSATLVPAATGPDPAARTIGNDTMTIDNLEGTGFQWEGEESNTVRFETIMRDSFAQSFRTLANKIEVDLCELYVNASRAYGTSGTTPFASTLADPANILRILQDNGAPTGDLQLVIDTVAGAKMRTLGQLTKANEAGDDSMLRRGVLMDIHGFMIRESAGIQTHTAGTATGFDANGGEPVGETTIVVDGSDSGTILQGDHVSWAGDSEKYIVQSATATGAASGNIVISNPGLQSALATTVEGTLGATYTANMGFARSAIRLMARAPMRPAADNAEDVVYVTDPVSGLTFEITQYGQYRRVAYEVAIAWGVKMVKPEHCAILLG